MSASVSVGFGLDRDQTKEIPAGGSAVVPPSAYSWLAFNGFIRGFNLNRREVERRRGKTMVYRKPIA